MFYANLFMFKLDTVKIYYKNNSFINWYHIKAVVQFKQFKFINTILLIYDFFYVPTISLTNYKN